MRLVLFDVDGTLISGRNLGRRSLEEAFAEVFSLPSVPSSRGHVEFNGAVDARIHAEMASWLGIPPEALHAARADLVGAYLRRLREACAEPGGSWVLPGVHPLLERLAAARDVALGLLTGNLEPAARIKLEPHDLNRFFPGGGFGSDADNRAAVARIARTRLEAALGLQVEPGRVVVVGDSVEDVRCARANSFRAVAVGTGFCTTEALAAEAPDHLLADLADTEDVIWRLG